MTDPQAQQAPATDDALPAIQAAVAELAAPDGLAELPLTELASRLTALHGQLQAALTDLDSA